MSTAYQRSFELKGPIFPKPFHSESSRWVRQPRESSVAYLNGIESSPQILVNWPLKYLDTYLLSMCYSWFLGWRAHTKWYAIGVQNNESLNERNLTISPNSKVLVASTDQKYSDIWATHSSLLPVLSPQLRVKLKVCDLLVIAISVVFPSKRLTLNVPKQILPSRLWVLLGVYSLGKRLHTCCVEHLESLKSPMLWLHPQSKIMFDPDWPQQLQRHFRIHIMNQDTWDSWGWRQPRDWNRDLYHREYQPEYLN